LAFGSDPLYEPGSIVILTLADPDFLVQRLAEHSIPALSVKDETADFSKTDSVFVSTIHSAKGMDFPVVIVLLDDIDEMRGKYASQEYTAQDCYPRLLRLLYVAVTRAMDVLDICYFKASSGTGLAPELLALKRAHQEMVSSFEAIISG
jgi:ATP-dependent exoDNAse (exonuclease V) beta subunit